MVNQRGYVLVRQPSHPRSDSSGYVREHILIMEKILSRFITKDECIHHIDEDKTNNDPGNLMLFATGGMHRAFHTRLNAFKASGQWHWRKCQHCKKHDDPNNLYINDLHRHVSHKHCQNKYLLKYLAERRLNQLSKAL